MLSVEGGFIIKNDQHLDTNCLVGIDHQK